MPASWVNTWLVSAVATTSPIGSGVSGTVVDASLPAGAVVVTASLGSLEHAGRMRRPVATNAAARVRG